MRRAVVVAALLALANAGVVTASTPRASLPDLEDEVMCLQCGTALNLSNAPVAERERAFIRREISRGRTKQQIKDALVERFGPAVLAMPDDKGFDLAAYLVPLLVAVLATVALLASFRRWRRPSRVVAAPTALDPADDERLERELTAYDRRLSRPNHPPD